MSVFAISDTHLSTAVNKEMDVFGNRWKNYTEKLEAGWRAAVSEGDTVVVPGDISWAMRMEDALSDLRFLDRLPGVKLIGRGNHDYWWNTVKKLNAFLADNGISTLRLLYNNAYPAEDLLVCGTRGWFYDQRTSPRDTDYAKLTAREAARLELSLDAADKLGAADTERAVFLHFPPVYGDFVCEEIVGVLKRRGVRRCFYGHIHGIYELPPSAVYQGIEFTIISADYLNFTPLKLN